MAQAVILPTFIRLCVERDEKIHFVILDYLWYFYGHCLHVNAQDFGRSIAFKKNGNNVRSNAVFNFKYSKTFWLREYLPHVVQYAAIP